VVVALNDIPGKRFHDGVLTITWLVLEEESVSCQPQSFLAGDGRNWNPSGPW
jgi:hypothetical protein